MSLISPNFDVVYHFFPIMARGLFAKLLEKGLLQLVCSLFQEELYKIIHGVLVNSETREAAMHYIATALNKNIRKSQIQVRPTHCKYADHKNVVCLSVLTRMVIWYEILSADTL